MSLMEDQVQEVLLWIVYLSQMLDDEVAAADKFAPFSVHHVHPSTLIPVCLRRNGHICAKLVITLESLN